MDGSLGTSISDTSVDYINHICRDECGSQVICSSSPGKGRVLLATRNFQPGEVLLRQQALLRVPEAAPACRAFEVVQELCETRPSDLPLEPRWYWLALASLTEGQRDQHDEVCGLPPAVTPEIQRRLLMLHGGSEPDTGTAGARGIRALLRKLGLRKIEPRLLERLVGAWTMNCFEHSAESPRSYATYFIPSFMSHSCFPTAIWTLDPSGEYVLRARRAIQANEEITIAYVCEEMLLEPARVRQRHLRRSKDFLCNCDRCHVGSPDQSRGMSCPVPSCGGSVFCRVLPRQRCGLRVARGRHCWRIRLVRLTSRRGPNLFHGPAAVLVNSRCTRCSHLVTIREAKVLLREERWLKRQVRAWEKSSPRGRLSEEAASRVADRIERSFTQHEFADRAYGHLVAVCIGLACRHKAECLMERRIAFQNAAYPGMNGAHAWTMESYAEMLLRHCGVEMKELRQQPQPSNALRPLLNDHIARLVADRVMPLYLQALDVSIVLFGLDHCYSMEVVTKCRALQKALESVAPSVATKTAEALQAHLKKA